MSVTRQLSILLLLVMISVPALAAGQEFAGREKLRAHSGEFRKEVIRVVDGVYVAVGFDLANVIMIDGPDGRIIVDTATGRDNASAIKAEFDKISTKPVKAIIYTHHHADHAGGASVFAGDDRPEIYAHRSLLPDRRVLMPGDNFNRAFPNLYAIRGVPLRRVDWCLRPDELVEKVKLPTELADVILSNQPDHRDARIKGRALTELGERQASANARNYYLSSAQFYLKQ